jgi:hypothetical protein
MTNDLELKRRQIAAARALADEVGTDFDRARILFAAADVESRAGEHQAACAMFEEGIGLVRNLGAPRRSMRNPLRTVTTCLRVRKVRLGSGALPSRSPRNSPTNQPPRRRAGTIRLHTRPNAGCGREARVAPE